MQLEAIASCPIASYMGDETNTCVTTTSFQVVLESNRVPPQPSLLQTEQLQLPQPLLTCCISGLCTDFLLVIIALVG